MNLGKKAISILTLILILLSFMVAPSSSMFIFVTVYTNKEKYNYRELVEVFGSIYKDGQPVEGGLVAIEVKSSSKRLLLRTVPTGTLGFDGWSVEITKFLVCDPQGNPVPPNIYRGENFKAYLGLTVKNNRITNQTIIMVITLYDMDFTVLLYDYCKVTLAPQSETTWITEVRIPEWSSVGTGMAFANVLTDWPEANGYPCCPEKSINFNILSSTPLQSRGALSPSSLSTDYDATQNSATYNMQFRLPPYWSPYNETYSISVVAFYRGDTDFANTTFRVVYIHPEDITLDGKIDIFDVVVFTASYDSKSGDPLWNPQLDIVANGKINIHDIVQVTAKYETQYELPP